MEHFASRGLGGEPPKPNPRRAETQAAAFDVGRPIPGLSASPPKPSSFLAATTCEIESAVKELVALNDRLGALADRVFGSPPETGGTAGGPVSPSGGAASDIERQINAVHALVQRAHFLAARLESL